MLYIKTTIWTSQIHGIWLFADQDITKWELLWEFIFWLDISLTEEQYVNLQESGKYFIDSYGWRDQITQKYMLNIDNSRFINHSKNPNIVHYEYKLFAARNIAKWEELTDNYSDFDDNFAITKIEA